MCVSICLPAQKRFSGGVDRPCSWLVVLINAWSIPQMFVVKPILWLPGCCVLMLYRRGIACVIFSAGCAHTRVLIVVWVDLSGWMHAWHA